MARQGLHQHRKFLRLARTLKSTPLARGVLEMLWEPAYDAGDDFLGDGEDIAARCSWTGSSVELVTALLESEFIDEDQDRPGHFRIHDLFDHAPDGVARRVEREVARLNRGTNISQQRKEAGRKGGLAKASKRLANVWDTPSKRLAKVATPPPTPTQDLDQAAAETSSVGRRPERAADPPPPPELLPDDLEALENIRAKRFGTNPMPYPVRDFEPRWKAVLAAHGGDREHAMQTFSNWLEEPWAQRRKPPGALEAFLAPEQWPKYVRPRELPPPVCADCGEARELAVFTMDEALVCYPCGNTRRAKLLAEREAPWP